MNTLSISARGQRIGVIRPFLIALAFCTFAVNVRGALYVGSIGSQTIGEYDSNSGAAINANFITSGVTGPSGLLVSVNVLYVGNASTTTVGKFDATTGAAINTSFITGLTFPSAFAISGNTLYVMNGGAGKVGLYDATTGAAINANFISLPTSLVRPASTSTMCICSGPSVSPGAFTPVVSVK